MTRARYRLLDRRIRYCCSSLTTYPVGNLHLQHHRQLLEADGDDAHHRSWRRFRQLRYDHPGSVFRPCTASPAVCGWRPDLLREDLGHRRKLAANIVIQEGCMAWKSASSRFLHRLPRGQFRRLVRSLRRQRDARRGGAACSTPAATGSGTTGDGSTPNRSADTRPSASITPPAQRFHRSSNCRGRAG